MARFGLSVAIATPFASDGAIDLPRLTAHVGDLMARGVEGITLFGTTGEGASIALSEREAVIAGVVASGIAPREIVAGVCATSVGDAGAQVAQAVAQGVLDFLLTPPFYFTGVGEDALFDWMAAVIRSAPADSRFLPYNLPQLTGVTITPSLLGRLCTAFPGRIRAVKDSSGVWASAEGFLRAGQTGVLVGDERLLPRAMREGAAGAISGMANVHPEAMRRIIDTGSEEPSLMAEVDAVVAEPVVPAIKALIARDRNVSGWSRVRPPLSVLPKEAHARMLECVDAARAE